MLTKDEIRQVLAEQQDEVRSYDHSKFIERDQLSVAHRHLNKNWIKVITGIRRCGKSVLARQMLQNESFSYINFDDERLIGLQTKDLNSLLQYLLELNPDTKILFFDEIQNVDGWELFANRLQRQGYNLVITGSNSKLLSKELATHLTGRYIPIPLSPFSFREFLKSRKISVQTDDILKTDKRALLIKLLNEFASTGGFPEMVVTGFYPAYLRELYDKIISRDINQRYSIKYGKTLKELALYSFSNLSNRMTYNKVKNIFDINSVHTIKNYFQYLEDAYLLTLLKPFSYKVKEQVRNPRKIYTVDNGLSRAISPKFTSDQGAALENLVFQELTRRQLDCTYFLDSDFEVDFVIKSGQEVSELIQACYSLENLETKAREIKALVRASKHTKCKNLKIITWDEQGTDKIDGTIIQIEPIWKWLTLRDQS